jgi:hypothetical protein
LFFEDSFPFCLQKDEDETDNPELGIDNVGGVFVVLIAGCGVSFLFSLLEFLWNVRKVAVEEKVNIILT